MKNMIQVKQIFSLFDAQSLLFVWCGYVDRLHIFIIGLIYFIFIIFFCFINNIIISMSRIFFFKSNYGCYTTKLYNGFSSEKILQKIYINLLYVKYN